MQTIELINQRSCCGKPKETISQLKKGDNKMYQLPVAIIGAGPVGLATAAHLAERGEKFMILEAGPRVGSNILSWGHVRVFSPWRYNIDQAAGTLLKKHQWESPDFDDLPLGKQIVEQYLEPIAELPEIKPFLYLNTKVLSVSRKGIDKMKTANREGVPFILYTEQNGDTKMFEARAVIDASGTWGTPNPAHSSGIWTREEQAIKDRMNYGIPDISHKDQKRYSHKRVAVIGGGHSAINALLELVALKEKHADTEIYWLMRKEHVEEAYGGKEKDALEARGALGIRIHQAVESGHVNVVTPFRIQKFTQTDHGIDIIGESNGEGRTIHNIDELIVNTGSRPDFSPLSELRLSIDTATESVEALAPLIDPNIHSCGTVRPHGEKELRQPEKDFYIAGIKSYGRAPTFLMATGYEQVRSIVAYLAGDFAAAEKVELVLPETGVCNSNLVSSSSCCGPKSSCC
ncbi:FAD-dependent oxidoreductase [Camelliibacillus cellulosilyticus]|uniref:FAD-dependent oxidoreductase n=1 Tax=Camelliibacillus cellulosilyticus TaxID=2174486 RepID=A0ABV9GK52_9BACL